MSPIRFSVQCLQSLKCMEQNETCKVSDWVEYVIWCVWILSQVSKYAGKVYSVTNISTVCDRVPFKHHLRWHHVQTHSKQQPKCSDGASPISPDTHEPWKHDVRSLVHNELRMQAQICVHVGLSYLYESPLM